MGVGKTTVSRLLMKKLPNSVFLDGDWCWESSPFVVTNETKAMVMDNICHLLNNFIHCSVYENIIFCWVMHQQEIIDAILKRLDTEGCIVHAISLTAKAEALAARLQRDIDAGVRTPDIIERSISRIPLYDMLNTIKINTTSLTADEAADCIMALHQGGNYGVHS